MTMQRHEQPSEALIPSPAPASLRVDSDVSPAVGPQRSPLYAFWRHRLALLFVLGICMAGGWYYLHRTPLAFTSSARVYVQQHAGSEGAPGEVTSADSYLYLQSELLKSNQLLAVVAASPEIANLETVAPHADKARVLRQGLDVQIDKGLSVLSISFSCKVPADAVKIVNAILDEYVASQTDSSRPSSSNSKIIAVIRTEKQHRDERLVAAQEDVQSYRQKHPELSYITDKGNVVIDRLATLSQNLTEAETTAIKELAAYESAIAAKDSSELLSQALANEKGLEGSIKKLREIEEGIYALEFEIAMRKAEIGTRHTRSVALQNQLAVANYQLDEMASQVSKNYIAQCRQRYEEASRLATEYRRSLDAQRIEASKLNALQAGLKALQDRLDQEQVESKNSDAKLRAIDTRTLEAVLNITVVQRGEGETLDITPRPRKVMAMAGVMGLALGALCAFLLDITDRKIRSVDEVRFALKRPVLGAVPHARGDTSLPRLGRQVELHPHSDVAEAFRIIRTALRVGARTQKTGAILVTSPFPSDGKTITCSNLAITMAKAGRRTLLIDADLRNPSVQKIYKLEGNMGLSSVLSGECDVRSAIQWSGIENLDILPAGQHASNPAELLNGDQFRVLLTQCGSTYDTILVDAPPVMPVADATIISAACKSTLLVMRAGKCTLKHGVESVDRLMNAGATMLGVIVNDVRRADGRDLFSDMSYPREGQRALPTASSGRTAGTAAAGDKSSGNGAAHATHKV
ncbi:MAG: polysaccharide biosynthesis tyrosine autokinase [Burkholderiales bacterium]|nr:polysaccharide biosynthesis tyrosine autokinase [Phycisphaerae bacterium]